MTDTARLAEIEARLKQLSGCNTAEAAHDGVACGKQAIAIARRLQAEVKTLTEARQLNYTEYRQAVGRAERAEAVKDAAWEQTRVAIKERDAAKADLFTFQNKALAQYERAEKAEAEASEWEESAKRVEADLARLREALQSIASCDEPPKSRCPTCVLTAKAALSAGDGKGCGRGAETIPVAAPAKPAEAHLLMEREDYKPAALGARAGPMVTMDAENPKPPAPCPGPTVEPHSNGLWVGHCPSCKGA